jgi:hypothetical protein
MGKLQSGSGGRIRELGPSSGPASLAVSPLVHGRGTFHFIVANGKQGYRPPCDGHHEKSDLGVASEPLHSSGDSVEPRCDWMGPFADDGARYDHGN